ncbi:uncharacterized protein SETTUDRAFT_110156 [Exserohilum turcica Et28A]|uniref:Mitochondrial fission 1 protein n=1 Tax=Exserohilum turcicum (strain 28A) TaxID=671987 RepID=R0JZ87_EXST2|nr:uncharacterized protein SETTUDRAFT_110156 [Exserohilum turcica Et28A]EOA86188.1 hypothetical protein SETTUDRAFT_110156 [Exserohilum turcica Et28A]
MAPSLPCEWEDDFWADEHSFPLDAADVESPLKPEELQVLRAQYEKEGEYVGLQTKFNYAWGLIKSTSRPDQQEGVRLLSEIFRNSRERRRECLYYLALGNYKLGNYAEARRYNELLLELEPANLQAGSLKSLIDEKVAKEGLTIPYTTKPRCLTRALLSYAATNPVFSKSSYDALSRRGTNRRAPAGRTTSSPSDNFRTQWPNLAADFAFALLSCPNLRGSLSGSFRAKRSARQPVQHGHEAPYRSWRHATLRRHGPRDCGLQVVPPRRRLCESEIANIVLVWIVILPRVVVVRMVVGVGATEIGRRPQGQQQGSGQGQGEGLFSGPGSNANQSGSQDAANQGADGGPQVRGGRFTYHGGVRILPRDLNSAGRAEPVDELTNVMTGLFAAFGAPPGHVHAHGPAQGGAQGLFGGEHNHGAGEQFAGNPILNLFSAMGMMGPGNMGDFVYSQEGLDRIVSQLMEQTATSNAPGPATQADIDALPRKEVTEEMLGEEHKAECSICMDEVNIGEQVTLLPCKHWFHHACISAWLLEHDTCPHCRKGITKGGQDQSNNPAPSGSQEDPTSQMPGAFTAGDGAAAPAGSPDPRSPNQGGTSDNGDAGSGNGGISDRIRRGLFGSPQ